MPPAPCAGPCPEPPAAPGCRRRGSPSRAFLGLTWLFLELEGRPLALRGPEPGPALGPGVLLGGVLAGAGLIALMALGVPTWAAGFHLVRNPQAGLARLAAGAWLYLAVAFSEELLFRGYLFQRLVRGLGPWPALALMALLFAGIHWGNPGMAGATRVWASLNIALAGDPARACATCGPAAWPCPWACTWAGTGPRGALLGFGVSGLPSQGWWTPVGHQRPALAHRRGRSGWRPACPAPWSAAAACLALVSAANRNGLLNE